MVENSQQKSALGSLPSIPAQGDELRRRFQQQWISGPRPSLAEFLGATVGKERASLMIALLDIDVQQRRQHGETPGLCDYIDAVPGEADVVRAFFAELKDSVEGSLATTTPLEAVRQSSVAKADDERRSRGAGRYELRDVLGKGGFGEVWRAYDPQLDRYVAVKLLRADRELSEESWMQFEKEARKLARLNHPSILRVHDIGRDAGHVYVVSELMGGGSLHEHLREYQDRPWEATALVRRIAEALHHAHVHGIVHRDVKPRNILLDESGHPHLADFGLAVTEEEQLHEAGGTVGTFAYMSPELARGESHHADPRSDIYSLGVVFYLLLTQRLPFLAQTAQQWIEQTLEREPRPPRTIDDRIPAELERICLKCLAKNIADRYTTALDLAEDLRKATAEDRRKSRRPMRARAAGAALLILILAGLGLYAIRERWTGVDQSQRISASNGAAPSTSSPAPGSLNSSRAELEEYPLRPNEWTQVLRSSPKLLLWPSQRETCSLLHDPEEKSLRVMCPYLGLLELGQTDLPVVAIQASVFQTSWEGGAGIFFGYHDDEDRGPAFKRFQAVTLERKTMAGQTKLLVCRNVYFMDESGHLLHHESIPVTDAQAAPGSAQVLEVVVADSDIRVHWGDEEGRSAPKEAVASLKPSDYRGRFGLLVSQASCVFRNVRVKCANERGAP